MNLKKIFETLRDQIEYGIDNIRASKKYLVSLSLSLVAFLILLIVLFISNSDFSVKKEANILVDDISSRKYAQAYDYYKDLEKEFGLTLFKRKNNALRRK